jgi:putative DNA primase/helicase
MLAPSHIDELRRSGLTDETIKRAGLYAATEPGVRDLLGFGAGSGLVFPYPELNGSGPYARVKLDATPPDGKRYRSPKGRPNRLYIPPLLDRAVLTDARESLYVSEGEKKALKACQEGLPCIAVPGVWSWKTRDKHDHSAPIPDLEHIVWQGRMVFVVYDSDLATNRKVRLAEYALAKELQRRGATVKAVRLPSGTAGQKVGLDDYLLTHSVEALCMLEPEEILDPETVAGEPIHVRHGDEHASPGRCIRSSSRSWGCGNTGTA